MRTGPALARVATLALLLAGCGGGGSGAGPGPPPVVAGATLGAISAFGSIVVNGVAWDTRGAAVTINGQPAAADGLRPGDVVLVSGELAANAATGTAERIDATIALRGPVIARGIARGDESRFGTGLVVEVLGQYVLVDSATLSAAGIDITSGAGLAPDTLIEVAGFRSFLTTTDPRLVEELGFAVFFDVPLWRATRIVPADPALPLLVTGRVTAVDPLDGTLVIDRLTVEADAASVDGFGGGSPVAGDHIRIIGGERLPDGTLRAERIERVPDPLAGLPAGVAVSVEGFRERTAPGAPDGTIIIAGGTLPLGTGSTPAASGPYRVAIVTGEPGSLESPTDPRVTVTSALRAPLEAIGPGGTPLQVLGRTVRPVARALYADRQGAGIAPLVPAELRVGDTVTVTGCVPGEIVRGLPPCVATDAGTQLVATQILREADDAGIAVRGTGGDRDGSTFALPALGFVVETVPETSYSLLGNAGFPADFDPLDCVGGGQFVGVSDTLRVAGGLLGPMTFTAMAVDFEACGALLPLPE